MKQSKAVPTLATRVALCAHYIFLSLDDHVYTPR
jgi:hypothetical protein